MGRVKAVLSDAERKDKLKNGIYKVTIPISVKALPGAPSKNFVLKTGTLVEVSIGGKYVGVYEPKTGVELSFKPDDDQLENLVFVKNGTL